MANQTVYPYGPDGQLPSGIGIINDLTTGGADKALSAEMGKVIGMKNEITNNADLSISDNNGFEILRLSEGHIKTKNFDSRNAGGISIDGRTLIIS